ncbi:UDP-N-acetylglucosamine 1-carboxyvinyltransferase [Desulfuribacillus stibiiarsenatis]|uniref:UDP-N-acetylglucosamine 1-carboxyvinyltransferase n=1 Tax=Desulfuribacillus stibiiarsenatis TaxID=1390249 RepID=A0A1E5L3W6_9FIRM|nr:UDP-N-acetylglucosamine 1-carboxyvinyltransferase [Desulfuribacillus stibiiarsenatis]OEH84713.1 UDP-N-acetylglucosamine 1-carboxyvinyltransferase [Desulfuribacillus stibiiarsenatis]
MERLVIRGGNSLQGSLRVHGSKNAALPILAASVLVDEPCTISGVPNLLDIQAMINILKSLGMEVVQENDRVNILNAKVSTTNVPDELMRKMRSSIFLMGPLLAKYGSVTVSRPGGCAIGSRRIDLHLNGLKALGASIIEVNGFIHCEAKRLRGADIYLDFPSVGATENIMMAASMAEGVTEIINPAREPEIIDLANFINSIGGRIEGAGTDRITIYGKSKLNSNQGHIHYEVISDRIVAGTIMVGAAMTNGDVIIENANPVYLSSVISKLKQVGAEVIIKDHSIRVIGPKELDKIDRIVTAPYPGFPTDMQPQLMSMLTIAKGTSIIKESVFEERFKHVEQLLRMGAKINVDLNLAFIRGVERLQGSTVKATDLRAGASLVLAGLVAEGETEIESVYHIDRGYENIEGMFRKLGADITRK